MKGGAFAAFAAGSGGGFLTGGLAELAEVLAAFAFGPSSPVGAFFIFGALFFDDSDSAGLVGGS